MYVLIGQWDDGDYNITFAEAVSFDKEVLEDMIEDLTTRNKERGDLPYEYRVEGPVDFVCGTSVAEKEERVFLPY